MAESILSRFFAGDVRALSRLLTLVEDDHPDAGRLLAAVYPKARHAYRIGLTGAPGAGKSTLVNLLAAQQMSAGASVAVIAVDPTSPFTGGALLGDRVRFDYPQPKP
ncbi:MAG: methylmalonyl Co-A mutase-associated GTPase MeaB, partial [Nevskiales bacterium]